MNPILIEALAIFTGAFFVILFEICSDNKVEWFTEEMQSVRQSTPLAIMIHNAVLMELN